MRARIIRLELPPRTALSENEFAAALGMSRTPVREALMLLAEDGLVEVLPQIGTFVTRIDPRSIADAQFLRESVELASLRSIEPPLDDVLLAELRENLAEQDRYIDQVEKFFRLDEEFHKGLMALAGHESTWAVVEPAKVHLDRARQLRIWDRTISEQRIAEHRAVLDAVVEADLEKAEDCLRHHLRAVFEDIELVRADHSELFVTDGESRPVRRSVIVWE